MVFIYLFHTLSELCLSPVALSFITKLAPARYASLMMGVYIAKTSLGNKVAGIIRVSANNYDDLTVFLEMFIFIIIRKHLNSLPTI